MWTLLLLWLCPPVSLVSPCPTGCCCPGAESLVLCESLGLRSLPRYVPLGTSALSVARNQLCDVDHQFSAFSGLQELSLGHNLLSRLPRGLPSSLVSLQLQGNRIAYVTSGALRKLGNLTRLDLGGNRVRAIQPGALQGLNELRVLTLRGNELTGLPRGLPPSLAHLDLSENCISALDPPSLSSLVNLQSLQVNSNCLRSVPERAFDGLARLRSLDLGGNLWACRCDMLYVYRWLLSGRVGVATDVVCTEPAHLAHHALLSLSVLEICPQVPGSNEWQSVDLPREGKPVKNETQFENPPDQTLKASGSGVPNPRGFAQHYSLEDITYDKCVSLTKMQSAWPNRFLRTTPALSVGQQELRDNATGHYPHLTATSAREETQPLPSANGDADRPTPLPRASPRPDSAVVVSLLALMCALLSVLTLALLLLLRKVLVRQRRVAPVDAGSGR